MHDPSRLPYSTDYTNISFLTLIIGISGQDLGFLVV